MTSQLRITISYRRHDSSGHAGRLYDDLAEKFGSEYVFMDIDAIEPGIDFGEAIDRALASADAFICLIGTDWLASTDAKGRRRLDNPEDFVRLEIEAALRREIRVIPVLVRGAEMPQSDELPESIRGLARRNAIEIRDSSWHYDVGRLISTLEQLDRAKVDAQEAQAADRPYVDAPKPQPASPERAAAADHAIPSHPAGREAPTGSASRVLARVKRLSTAKKLLTVGGVALLGALLVVGSLQLLSGGTKTGERVPMLLKGGLDPSKQPQQGFAHLEQERGGPLQLGLQMKPVEDKTWTLLLFDELDQVDGFNQPPDEVEQVPLEFETEGAQVEEGGFPYAFVDVQPNFDSHTYFGIGVNEEGWQRLVLYASWADLGTLS
jgi:TIR domain